MLIQRCIRGIASVSFLHHPVLNFVENKETVAAVVTHHRQADTRLFLSLHNKELTIVIREQTERGVLSNTKPCEIRDSPKMSIVILWVVTS
jgi:hypothetical protein